MVRPRTVAAFLNRAARVPGARALGRAHALLFRLTGGRFLRSWWGGSVLTLEVTGRKSGKRRATPLIYMIDDGDPIVVAANAGNESMPAWWLNLRDAGRGTIYLEGRRQEVTPRLIRGTERTVLWSRFVEMSPATGFYTRYTSRELPMVRLHRRPADAAER